MNETAPNTPNANASPLGWMVAVKENKPPDKNGPTARPPALRVCARPLRAPRTVWFGAELVTYRTLATGPKGHHRVSYQKQGARQATD